MRAIATSLALVFLAATAVACSGSADAVDDAASQSLDAKYQAWDAFAKSHGMPRHTGRARVIGVRGRDSDGNVHSTTIQRGIFDDSVVVLGTDGSVTLLSVSTHPWEISSSSSPDVDGDGKGDVGMLLPGRYQAVARGAGSNIAGLPTYHVVNVDGTDGLTGVRNTEHLDHYTQEEFDASRERGDKLTAILFHKGGDGAPNAIGCQVLDADGIATLSQKASARFDYLLVDANDTDDLPSATDGN
jgi:hypothetical protein